MLAKLRQILLTQYIGAIITAYVGAQALASFVAVVGFVITSLTLPAHTTVLGTTARVDWGRVVPELTKVILDGIVISGLWWWLYGGRPSESEISDHGEQAGGSDSAVL
ncbi:MAG TPA: hypothetical protein VGL89_00265 [Candidatus Koribacter sp.]|jgi:hypothetical protein